MDDENKSPKSKKSLRSLSEKMSEASISITPASPVPSPQPIPSSQTSPTTTERHPLRPNVLRVPQEKKKSPSVSPKRKLEKENSPLESPDKLSVSPSKKLKFAGASEKSGDSKPTEVKVDYRSPEEDSPSKMDSSDEEMSRLTPETRKKLKKEDDRYLGLEYGLLPADYIDEFKISWFSYKIHDNIKKYYELMMADSEEKTKDCERCNKDIYDKLVKLYKLGLEEKEDIPVQGFMRRDSISCAHPIQSSCDCLVTCEKCDVLYSNWQEYEGNTAPSLAKHSHRQWQGVIDKASSDKDLPELLNPDGSVYKENMQEQSVYQLLNKYDERESYREDIIVRAASEASAEEREGHYKTELEKIVKENLLNYRFNRLKLPCRYGHVTCKYSSERNRVIQRSMPKYIRKEENPNFSDQLKNKWEPY